MEWAYLALAALVLLIFGMTRRPSGRPTTLNVSEWRQQIEGAIREKRTVRLLYFAQTKNETTEREVTPKSLRDDGTGFRAYCHLRRAPRNFLFAGIRTLKLVDPVDQAAPSQAPSVQEATFVPSPPQETPVVGTALILAPPSALVPIVEEEEVQVNLAGTAKRGIVVTTEEELAFYAHVARICDRSPRAKPLGYKDTVSYFGVNLCGRPHSWFLRGFFNGSRKYITTKLPVWLAAVLARGCQVDAPPKNLGNSRIYFPDSIHDVAALDYLVSAAFEYELHQDSAPQPANISGV